MDAPDTVAAPQGMTAEQAFGYTPPPASAGMSAQDAFNYKPAQQAAPAQPAGMNAQDAFNYKPAGYQSPGQDALEKLVTKGLGIPSLKEQQDQLAQFNKSTGLSQHPQDQLNKILNPENFSKMGVGIAMPMASVLMRPLGYAERAVTTATIDAADALGIPYAHELKQKVNPEGKLLPETMPSDISSFAFKKMGDYLQVDQMAPVWQNIYKAADFGIGAMANFFFDPMRKVSFGELTEGAKDLQKVGIVDTGPSQERNAVSVTNLKGQEIAKVPLAPIVDNLNAIPGVKPLAAMIRAFSPDTGTPEIDRDTTIHARLGYGQEQAIKLNYLMPEADKNFSDSEKGLIQDLAETTPNLQPDIHPDIIKAAGTKLNTSEDSVRQMMTDNLESMAKKHGVTLPEGRDQAVIDSAINAKKSNSRAIEAQVRSGHITAENVNDKVLDNYMPHVLNPAFETQEGQAIHDLLPRKVISSADITKQRKLSAGMTVDEANQYVKEKFGKDNFFITDPHIATATRELRALKLERDTNLLETVSKYGQRVGTPEGDIAKSAGWKPILHPDFNEKKITLAKTPEGQTQVVRRSYEAQEGDKIFNVKHGEFLFPPEIASKMQYYLNPKAMYNFKDSLGEAGKYLTKAIEVNKDLNQITRASAFMSEGMWGRNTVNNIVKSIADGMEPIRLKEAADLMRGKGGFTSEPNALAKRGNTYTAKDLQDIMAKYGVSSGNAFRDGVSDFLNQAKQLSLSQTMQAPGRLGLKFTAEVMTKVMEKVTLFGQYGENLTRMAHVLQKLHEGYEPPEAVLQMERHLFDYRRNSAPTDAIRFFMPFKQHPIKSALSAPMIIGKAPGLYNFVSNALPHQLAVAMQDPTTQNAVNQILPDFLKMRDVVAGPLLRGNTWLSSLFTNPKQPGSLPSLAYVDIKNTLGMGILNHWDMFSQAARDTQRVSNYGLSPFFGALLGVMWGKDNFDKPINGLTQGLNYMLWNGIAGNVSFPNTAKFIQQSLGIGNKDAYEPNSVLLMKGMFGQFGGITELTQDYNIKLSTLKSAEYAIKDQAHRELGPIMNSITHGQNEFSVYAKSAKMAIPISNHELYAEIQQKMQEQMAEKQGQIQNAQAARGFLSGKSTAEDFVSRIKGIQDEMKYLNQSFQFGANRYLEMSKGAKSPTEARAMSGVKLHDPGR